MISSVGPEIERAVGTGIDRQSREGKGAVALCELQLGGGVAHIDRDVIPRRRAGSGGIVVREWVQGAADLDRSSFDVERCAGVDGNRSARTLPM